MPATEQTYRNQKLLHAVFAVSGMVLLICTIFMFAADHFREWKRYQRQYRTVDLKFNSWRRENAEEEQLKNHARLSAALLTAESQPVDGGLFEQFQQAVEKDSQTSGVTVSFDRIQEEMKKLDKLSATAGDLRATASQASAAADDAEKAYAAAQVEARKQGAAPQAAASAEEAGKKYQEARQAARECGVKVEKNTRAMWRAVWES